MNNFKDNKFFLESIDKKDFFSVKSSLANMLRRVSKREVDTAIEYAISKGAFRWETHDNDESKVNWDNSREEYNFEKERLVQNFSRERYNKVQSLLNNENTTRPHTNIHSRPTQNRNNGDFSEKKFKSPQPDIYKSKTTVSPVAIIAGVLITVVALIIMAIKS